MLIVVVHVHVVPDGIEAFERATLENARASLREPGIARFDVIRQQDDPQRYLLIEVYRSPDAPAAHKDTAHYLKWRDAVAPLMASPRTSHKYDNLVPPNTEGVPNAEMPIWPGSPCPSPAQRGRGEPGADLGHEALAPPDAGWETPGAR